MKKQRKRGRAKVVLGVIALVIVGIAGYVFISGWLDGLPKLKYDLNEDGVAAVSWPDTDFAVISDLHYYSHTLGTDGAAFEATLLSDRKLLLDSEDLLDFAIGEILDSEAKFVLISGDLTKDGERINHEIVRDKLARLTDAGLAVLVVPGNHDVNNPDAVSYDGENTERVASVTAAEFADIYAGFGYGGALDRDTGSLSYVAEPVPGLRVLALDTCRYRENREGEGEIVGGRISQGTADWIARTLRSAGQQGKAVIATSHHGIVEHWDGQGKLHPDYLIDDYIHVGEFLASYDVRLVFTGHYHAQDITTGVFNDKSIYDVMTGSLITAPCPIRYCSVKDGRFSVSSDFIVDKLRPGTGFAQDAADFVKATVYLEAYNTLKKYRVSDQDSDYFADAIGDAFSAHYSGDENPSEMPGFDAGRLGPWGRVVYFIQGYVLDGLWADLPPADNNAAFSLY